MNLRDGLILRNRYRPAVGGGALLPSLLARRLRLHNDPRIRPVECAVYEDIPRRAPLSNLTLEEATVDVVKHIDANEDEIAYYVEELRQARLVNKSLGCTIMGLFRRFDKWFFMDKLTGHVLVDDVEVIFGPNDSGKTFAQFHSGNFRAGIALNGGSLEHVLEIRERPQAQDLIIAVLLHQMIHAYFLVACGPQDSEKKSNELLTHGEHFGIVLHKIKSTAPGLPLDFGNTMPEISDFRWKYDEFGGRTFSSQQFADRRKITTECARDVKVLKEEDCKDWYKNKCLKALDPDIYVFNAATRSFDKKPTSKCGSKSDWVEISHKKDPYKLPKKVVNTFASLKKKFEETRKLEVSSDIKKEIFEEFICFMCEDGDDYTQTLSLKKCIELYQLAASIKFEELKDAMFDAMYGEASRIELLSPTLESLHDVLRAVYASSTPDKDLRTWAQDYLRKNGLDILKVAQRDPRFIRLRSRYPALKQDLDQVLRDPAARAAVVAMNTGHPYIRPTIVRRTLSPERFMDSYTIAPPPIRPFLIPVETRVRPQLGPVLRHEDSFSTVNTFDSIEYQEPIFNSFADMGRYRRDREFVEDLRQEQANNMFFDSLNR